MKPEKIAYIALAIIAFVALCVIIDCVIFGIEGITKPTLPDHGLHYNYGIIKEVDGIWYKTTYFGFEDGSQSISVYYGSKLFDFAMGSISKGDHVIVVWKWVNTKAETFDGWITIPWCERIVRNGDVVFP